MALLGKLVSMAIAVGRVPILECAATWLQRSHPVYCRRLVRVCVCVFQRSHPVYCRRLVRVLVDDYCSLLPGSMVPTLNNLSCSCPPFCCQFITAVTTLYDLSTEELTPPVQLLQMVVSWIQDQPRLVLITLLNTPPSSSQPIGSLDLTPLAGLVRWCVKAPLAYRRDGKQDLANGTTETELEAGPLFSELHLSVLQVLLLLPGVLREKGLLGRLALLQPDQLTSLISDLSGLLEELNPLHSDTQAHIQLTLDRLAQALQVSMAAGALLCSREDLRALCSRLPHNNLLQLVMSGPVQQSGFYPHIHTPPLGYSPRPSPLGPHPSSHSPSFPPQPFLPSMAFPFRPSH
ncbi:integrator complex subunit 15-like isoform X4 [Oncorhynchus keta]|nr:integrator complex subunit 15-like isoform X4 [Oncorhynchus keta]XP_052358115.1 integrator complex subunit 15-like isoform X4 [Oncorhynchus keta]XP_052358117.1 integrator complex subunit 15-like isoform X4 [Oncorhynchus keta]XP_052358118.1 integrator complex subunit 15-like isoform X4 [Oncorhynchus keta]